MATERFILLLAIVILPFAPQRCGAQNASPPVPDPVEMAIYVSPHGNDSWTGANPNSSGDSKTGPLATLRQARLKVREILGSKPNRPVTVYVRGGTYLLSEPLELDAEDSGTTGSPVTYRSYPNESVTLSGGREIAGFSPYKAQILRTDVSKYGLGGVYFRQLFLAGNRQPLARYPNADPSSPATGGWAFVDGTPVDLHADLPTDTKTRLLVKSGDFRKWGEPSSGELVVFPRFNWWNNILPITSVDPQNRIINLKNSASYAIRPGDRYYVRNLLEELDSPGEWHLDKAANMLYFWPPASLENKGVMAPAIKTIFHLDPGASNIILRGFTIEMTENSAIVMDKTSHCLVAGNTIRHAGDYAHNAVEVSGTANGVVGNDIYDVGAGAVHLTGGDTPTLTSAGNYAENNYIHHTGVEYKQGVGIFIQGVGNRASHNLIHDTPRFGIRFQGNNHTIEFNEIRDTNLETEDTAAIGTDAQYWSGARGSVIHGNYIHDTFGLHFLKERPLTPYLSWGIYLDDYSAGVTVDGNIVVGSCKAGIFLHNGSFNRIKNNIFVDNHDAQAFFEGAKTNSQYWVHLLPQLTSNYMLLARAPAWDKVPGGRIDPQKASLPDGTLMQGNSFDQNILYNRGNVDGLLYHFVDFTPAHNSWNHNLIYNFNSPVLADNPNGDYHDKVKERLSDWQQRSGMDKDSVVADPLFVDPKRGNYDLRPDSPAHKLGIKTTPMKDIGPYRDPLRATWPIVEAQGARERGNR